MKPELILRSIKKMIEPLKRSIQLTIGRAVLASVKDSTGIQEVKVSLFAGEVKEMERFQNYGFTSVPLATAEGVCVFVGGNREHGIALAVDDRKFRLKSLPNGAVALYDAFGTKIVLTNNGEVEINAATQVNINSATKVKIDSTAVEIGTGTLEKMLKGETFQAFFNSHTHVGNLGVATSPPSSPSTAAQLSQVVKGS